MFDQTFEYIFSELTLFLLVYIRVIGAIMVAPVVSQNNIPFLVKASLSLFIATAIFSVVKRDALISYPHSFDLGYVILLLGELLIGIIIGFSLQAIFAIFTTAGQLFAVQMGMGSSQIFDPTSNVNSPVLGQYLNLIAIFIFLQFNGLNRFVIMGLVESFYAMNAISLAQNPELLLNEMIALLSFILKQALLIAIPLIGVLGLISTTMGLLAKASPQMNLLMVSFPLQIGVGFAIFLMAIPFFVEKIAWLMNNGYDRLSDFFLHYSTGGI